MGSIVAKRILLVLFLNFMLVGCQPPEVEAPSENVTIVPTVSPPESGSPTAGVEVESSSPTPEPTATAVPPTEPAPEPTATATPLPPEPEPAEEGGIEAFAILTIETAIDGRIRGIYPGSNNSVWVVWDEAALRWEDGRVAETLTALPGRFVGEDTANGLVWVADLDNDLILSWDSSNWVSYGEASGWAAVDTTAPAFVRAGQNDANGRFWVSTNADVRFFDGEYWQHFTPEEMGLENIVTYSSWFNFSFLPAKNGDVWVGTCHVNPPGPNGGQAVRIYQEGSWQTVTGPPEASCTTSMQGDPAGSLWANFDGDLWNRAAPEANWEGYFPPTHEFGTYGTVADIAIDENGDAWVLSVVCGGASCGTTSSLFHIADGVWTPVPGWMFPAFAGSALFVDEAGNLWADINISLVWVATDTQTIKDVHSMLFATQTEDGRIWFIAEGENREPILYSLSSD